MLHGRLNGVFGPVYPRCNAEARGKTGFVHSEPLAQGVFQSYKEMTYERIPLKLKKFRSRQQHTIIIDVVKPRLVGRIGKWRIRSGR